MTPDQDQGHPETTSGSGKFQQQLLHGDNRLHTEPKKKLPVSGAMRAGAPGTNAQAAALQKG